MGERRMGKIIHFPGGPYAGLGLQFRVDLLMVESPVWRRLVVPANSSFWDFHVALQDVMGWQDKHLHLFKVDGLQPGTSFRVGIPDENDSRNEREILPGWDYKIGDYFKPDLGSGLYSYDFGDGWQHEVNLEGILSNLEPEEMPTCLAGEGLCPFEDCGGPLAWKDIVSQGEDSSVFLPESVVFDNPRKRWLRTFGHD